MKRQEEAKEKQLKAYSCFPKPHPGLNNFSVSSLFKGFPVKICSTNGSMYILQLVSQWLVGVLQSPNKVLTYLTCNHDQNLNMIRTRQMTTRITLDSLLRGKITFMLKIKNF